MVNLYSTFKKSLAVILALAFVGGAARAQDTILTISNAITGAEVTLTEAEFMALDQVVMNTENEWVDNMTAFEGPLARDVLALVTDFDATMVTLTAVDDYSVETPIEYFLEYGAIFAHSQDGKRLSRRSRGPIWVLYPLSENPELQDPAFNQYQIFQLAAVVVH